jgi:hypothetical protein
LFGSDIVKAEVLNARKIIEEDKQGGKPLTDFIDDAQFADAEHELDVKNLLKDPFVRANLNQHIKQTKL